MKLPDFAEFLMFFEEHEDEYFSGMLEMDIISVEWPMSENDFKALLQKVQMDASRHAVRASARFLRAYHEWLSENLPE